MSNREQNTLFGILSGLLGGGWAGAKATEKHHFTGAAAGAGIGGVAGHFAASAVNSLEEIARKLGSQSSKAGNDDAVAKVMEQVFTPDELQKLSKLFVNGVPSPAAFEIIRPKKDRLIAAMQAIAITAPSDDASVVELKEQLAEVRGLQRGMVLAFAYVWSVLDTLTPEEVFKAFNNELSWDEAQTLLDARGDKFLNTVESTIRETYTTQSLPIAADPESDIAFVKSSFQSRRSRAH